MAESIKVTNPNIGSKTIGSTGASTEWNAIVNAIDATQSKSNNSVDLGLGAINTQTNSVVIGHDASDADIVGSTGGDERIAIGNQSEASSWRAVCVGSKAIARQVSSTAVGYGTVAIGAHATAFGRGAYCNIANTSMIGAMGNTRLIIANAHGMDFEDITGTSYGVRPNPELEEVEIQGRDGKDWKDVPTYSNLLGGNVAITSGGGTGTGTGGEVRFKTAPVAGGTGNNTVNPKVVAGKFDSALAVDTRFFLLDVTDGTLKRVQFGADDSAGVGFKVLKVAN